MRNKCKDRLRLREIVLIAALVLTNQLFAQYERPGSSSAQFLKIGVSAKASGMGGAFIACVSGAEAGYYNPAALAGMNKASIVFSHNKWFAGINHDYFAAALTLRRYGSFGISFTSFMTDEMAVRTPLQPDGTGETFYAGNTRLGISYARNLTNHVAFGGTIGYIKSTLYATYTEEVVAIDISTLYKAGFRDFRFGMKISNFGSSMTFINEMYPLPINFVFGMSMNAIEGSNQGLLVSVSAVKPNEGRPQFKLGMEWNYNKIVFLRSGYNLNHGIETYSFGGGLITAFASQMFGIDYSYSDFSLLGAAHRFSLSFEL